MKKFPPEKTIGPKAARELRGRREVAGRNGKPVIVLFSIPASEPECLLLAQALKKSLGTGGTFKDGRIELQGDHREKVEALLLKQGFRVKWSGG